jgi:hypothetical protein
LRQRRQVIDELGLSPLGFRNVWCGVVEGQIPAGVNDELVGSQVIE